MINAAELRIGNWVTSTRGPKSFGYGTRGEWQVEYDDFVPIVSDPEGYDPIPLTEEWLLRFGFENNDNVKFSDSFYRIAVGSSEFNINPDNGVVWIDKNENTFNNPCLVESVYQLQNLYFALTGKELSLNTPGNL